MRPSNDLAVHAMHRREAVVANLGAAVGDNRVVAVIAHGSRSWESVP
jgi:hypothetical protein